MTIISIYSKAFKLRKGTAPFAHIGFPRKEIKCQFLEVLHSTKWTYK